MSTNTTVSRVVTPEQIAYRRANGCNAHEAIAFMRLGKLLGIEFNDDANDDALLNAVAMTMWGVPCSVKGDIVTLGINSFNSNEVAKRAPDFQGEAFFNAAVLAALSQ